MGASQHHVHGNERANAVAWRAGKRDEIDTEIACGRREMKTISQQRECGQLAETEGQKYQGETFHTKANSQIIRKERDVL